MIQIVYSDLTEYWAVVFQSSEDILTEMAYWIERRYNDKRFEYHISLHKAPSPYRQIMKSLGHDGYLEVEKALKAFDI